MNRGKLRLLLSRKVTVLYVTVFGIIVLHRRLYSEGPSEDLLTRYHKSGQELVRRWITFNGAFYSDTKNQSNSQHERKAAKRDVFNLKKCIPNKTVLEDLSNIKTPFKFYIYDLPPKFNTDLLPCLQKDKMKNNCYSLDHCGMGRSLFNIGRTISVRDSHMFSLEVVLHHKLMFSTYRTMDPNEADIFYIPVYAGLKCLCYKPKWAQESFSAFVKDLIEFLQKQTYFVQGKLHFSSFGKIQREMQWTGCPYLSHMPDKNITFFTIEKETSLRLTSRERRHSNRVLSAPYPSYIHYISGRNPDFRDLPGLPERDVFVFLAAGRRRSNPDRALVMDQFSVRTSLPYDKVKYSPTFNDSHNMVFYYTDECSERAKWGTVPWMLHSVFCLQPPGDSPTRKSFFDAILSGCIPVLFPYDDQESAWPFLDHFQLSKFTVKLSLKSIEKENMQVLDVLKQIPSEEIESLHNNVRLVSQWFQYGLPDGSLEHPVDAMFYIFKELQMISKLHI